MPTNTSENKKIKKSLLLLTTMGEYMEISLLQFILLFEFHIHILHLPFQMNEFLSEFC